ncbi:peptidase S8/S53 domain-containing protein [Thermothelomyces heterothallicus CBS 202.75]|uniref:peptidase S8/S53 domain-containing protein n=1 Tax=Thermothelomyces heterothallicus CBS 202.75 TaxID=1149848 RepID=UPI003743E173
MLQIRRAQTVPIPVGRSETRQIKSVPTSVPGKLIFLNHDPASEGRLSASATSLAVQETRARSSSTGRALPESASLGEPYHKEHHKSLSSPPTKSSGRDLACESTPSEDTLGEQRSKTLEESGPKPALVNPRKQHTEELGSGVDNPILIASGVNPGLPKESDPKSSVVNKGSISDATQRLVDDTSVDIWFGDIEKINEEILEPYRRQACKRVKVGILDTGIDMKNMAFHKAEVRQRIKKRVDFCDPNSKGTGRDKCGHGTHCAALINRIAPAADIYIGRVAIDFDSGLDENVVAKAITIALGSRGPGDASNNWDVDILSLSLGFQHYSEAIDTALRTSTRKGKIILAAASNNGTLRAMAYPAWDPNVIPINSANARGRPSDFNPPAVPGRTLTILGENVPSAWITTNTTETTTVSTINKSGPDDAGVQEAAAAAVDLAATKRMSGTSVATAIAAGLVALLFELAMVEVPNDPVTQATLSDVLLNIKRQAGLNVLLMGKAARTGDFHNIVPTNLLNPNLTLGENAAVIKGVLASWFGSRRPIEVTDSV